MRECPQCGYRDGIYWWPRVFEPGVDFARLEDVEKMDPILAGKLKTLVFGRSKSFLADGPYVYKVTKTKVVHRLEKFLFTAQNGFFVGTDGAGSPRSAAYKKQLSRRGREKTDRDAYARQKWIRAALQAEQARLGA